MKASEITLGVEIRIETDTDAINVWPVETKGGQGWHRANWLRWYGDSEVVYDATYNFYRVPALAEKIARYSNTKAEHCARWGSE